MDNSDSHPQSAPGPDIRFQDDEKHHNPKNLRHVTFAKPDAHATSVSDPGKRTMRQDPIACHPSASTRPSSSVKRFKDNHDLDKNTPRHDSASPDFSASTQPKALLRDGATSKVSDFADSYPELNIGTKNASAQSPILVELTITSLGGPNTRVPFPRPSLFTSQFFCQPF